MKLFYLPGACSLAPHIVLCETETPVTLVKVDRSTKQTDEGADFLDINPKGYVPALQLEDGQVLTEAQVILQYLADQPQGSALAPRAGTLERYQLQEWLSFISTELHKTVGSFFNPKQTPDWKAVATDILHKRLAWLEEQLQGREFALGNTFSVADAYLFTVLSWTVRVKFDLSPWPAVQAYHGRMAQRPSVQQALREEGLA